MLVRIKQFHQLSVRMVNILLIVHWHALYVPEGIFALLLQLYLKYVRLEPFHCLEVPLVAYVMLALPVQLMVPLNHYGN